MISNVDFSEVIQNPMFFYKPPAIELSISNRTTWLCKFTSKRKIVRIKVPQGYRFNTAVHILNDDWINGFRDKR